MMTRNSKNILIQYLSWQFFEVPREILKAWRNFLLFNLNYFSLPLLLKTYFSYWRRYQWSYPRGINISGYLEVAVSNLFSRVMGAVMRSFLILIGILMEILIILAGLIIFLVWILLPFLLLFGLIFGFKIIF